MNTLVIDASIAVKWVVEEDGTPQALALRNRAKLIAPELLLAEGGGDGGLAEAKLDGGGSGGLP